MPSSIPNAPGGAISRFSRGWSRKAAPLDLLDYVGIGGVFATSSKDNPSPPIGPSGLARIVGVLRRRAPKFPLCAIAGIDAGNASETITAGADGVAVISALSRKDDP